MSLGRPRRAGRWRMRRPGFLTTPAQGFSALAAFLLLMGLVGVAVADARRTVGPGSHETDFIAWLTILSAVIGYVVARSSLPLQASSLDEGRGPGPTRPNQRSWGALAGMRPMRLVGDSRAKALRRSAGG